MKNNKKTDILNICKIYFRTIKLLYKVNSLSLIFLLILSIILGTLPGITLILMQKLINGLQSSIMSIQELFIYLFTYLFIDLSISLLGNAYGYYSNKFSIMTSMEVDTLILQKTEELKLSHFEDSEAYNIIQRAGMTGGGQLYEYFLKILIIIQSFSSLIISILILFNWNLWANCIIIIVTLVNTIFKLKLSKKQYEIVVKRTEKTRECNYYHYLLTNDIAFKEIKLFRLHSYFIEKYRKLRGEFFLQDINLSKEIKTVDNSFVIIEQIIDFFILSNIIIDAFSSKIMVGDTVTYIRTISNIKSNVKQILNETVSIYNKSLFISQLFDFLDILPDTSDGSTIKVSNIYEIEAKNLYYKYTQSQEYTLKNINFRWLKGDHIILVGKNGSGKTTLLKIILGFYENYEGKLYINGLDLKSIDKNSLRDKISTVFQDFNKYELSLRENIGLGNVNKIQNEQYIKKIMQQTHFSEKFFSNINMQLGFWFKNGIQLSGGEWTKVAIARAFSRITDIYIWDEPDASLDSVAEKEIWNSINQATNNKISILITHRLENIKLYKGEIIIFKSGKIIDTGSHNELIKHCEEYIEMFNSTLSD